MQQEQTFNHVYVIESLASGHLRTGTNVFEQVIYPETFNLDALEASLMEPNTACDFLSCLDSILKDAQDHGRWPIIQIDAHGSQQGLRTAAEDFLAWEDLKDKLTQINVATQFNLFVVLSACSGAYLISVVHPGDRAPVWGLLGPAKSIAAGDLEDGLRAFYTELLHNFEGDDAVAALRSAVRPKADHFVFYSAETLFKRVYARYYRDHCSTGALQKREDEIVQELMGRYDGEADELLVRAGVRELLRDQRRFFEEHRRRFFMYDLFPQNTSRFSVSYDEVATEEHSKRLL